jgi:hypothetical protein
LLLAICQPAASFADEDQDLFILKTLILKPGDVINFKGGWGAVLGVGEYGHTGMYLGKDPDSGKPMFLDFTITKKGRNPEFGGRVSSEEEFLNDNIGHKEFNVYRLNGTETLDQKKLLEPHRILQSINGMVLLIAPMLRRGRFLLQRTRTCLLSKSTRTGSPMISDSILARLTSILKQSNADNDYWFMFL